MVRFKKKKGADGYHTDSDSVSELSHDSSINSKSSKRSTKSTRYKFSTFRKKSSSVSEGSASSASITNSVATQESNQLSHARPSTRETTEVDKKRLLKDAKSRYNIGLVYLKTEDYAKAQENLEHSLFCYVQLAGHDTMTYTNDIIFAIAGVREKLGDCYFGNPAIEEKFLALDHYEDARRLLKSVHPEDAPANITDMLQRVEKALKQPGLVNSGSTRRTTVLNRGTIAQATARTNDSMNHRYSEGNKNNASLNAGSIDIDDEEWKSLEAISDKLRINLDIRDRKYHLKTYHNCFTGTDLVNYLVENNLASSRTKAVVMGQKLVMTLRAIEHVTNDHGFKDEPLFYHFNDPNVDCSLDIAMAHLERNNHRTALSDLKQLQKHGGTKSKTDRNQLADAMLKVAASASEVLKLSPAADAYEAAYSLLKQDEDTGDNMKLAVKGCIRSNKLLAKQREGIQDYESAIEHRRKVCQFLDEDNRTIPACQQRVKIAFLHGENEEFFQCTAVLSDAIGKLLKGVKSIDNLESDRRDLLIQSYQMQAICYAKLEKWKDALDQYNDVLPLVANRDGKNGQGSKQYNTVLIHISVLHLTLGNHHLAASSIDKYMRNAIFSQQMAGDLIVEDLDHVNALSVSAATHIKLDDMEKAISVLTEKLAFVKTLPNNDEMKSDTMHKLGCLLANESKHEKALPMLNEALRTKKVVHGGNHKSVLETTWAVAATNQTLGDVDEALKEYTVLLDNMTNINDMPVDAVVILHCAGKLFFGYGKIARALQCFRQALHESETAKNPQLKSEIKLNLANALSAGEEVDEAMELYDQLLKTKSLKKTTTLFLTKFNKSLLLIKIGKVEEAQETLLKMVENKSTAAKDVRGRIFLTLGNLALLDGNIGEALGYLGNALDEVGDDDLSALVHTKRSIAMAHLKANQIDEAISTLEGVLGDLSNLEEKSVNLLRAEIWNCLAHVYKQKQDLLQAKNFAKLALLTYKTELGETNPITLRNVSNLQLLLLEEAEDLEPSKAKSIIDAAQYELEDALETFVSLYDPWTYRLDVASLKTNLGFVAVWQDKPKKARKLVCQIRDIPLPQEHPLVHRVTILEERLGKLEKKHGFKSTAAAGKPRKQPKSKSTEGSRGPAKTTQRTKKKGNAYKFRK